MRTAQKVLKIRLKEDPGFEVVQIVLVDDELDQLHAHHEGEEDARNGDDDCLREGADHVKDAAVPGLGRLSHLGGNARDLLVERVKESGQIVVMPLMSSSLSQLLMASSRKSIAYLLVGLPAQTGRRNPEHTHPSKPESSGIRVVPMRGDTTASHELFYPQLGVKLCSMAGGGVQKIYMVFLREPSRQDRSGSDLFHLRDGFEIKMNFDRNVSCFIFVNALMHDDFFD